MYSVHPHIHPHIPVPVMPVIRMSGDARVTFPSLPCKSYAICHANCFAADARAGKISWLYWGPSCSAADDFIISRSATRCRSELVSSGHLMTCETVTVVCQCTINARPNSTALHVNQEPSILTSTESLDLTRLLSK